MAILGGSAVRSLLRLTRVRIALGNGLAAATGYALAAESVGAGLWLAALGVVLMAAGASALNQAQEARIDAAMARTRSRPIPFGLLRVGQAVAVAFLLLMSGAGVLALVPSQPALAVALGLAAAAWYNGVYTYLKRVTAFAAIPGALTGAVPPAIGWVAGGGRLGHPAIVLVAGFFFVCQIPHFWMLFVRHGADYERAGLPSLTGVLQPRQLGRVTYVWVAASVAAGVVLAGAGPLRFPWNVLALLPGLWLLADSAWMLEGLGRESAETRVRRAFLEVNLYALAVMTGLLASGAGWLTVSR